MIVSDDVCYFAISGHVSGPGVDIVRILDREICFEEAVL